MIRFLFDIQCPYAYLASQRIETMARELPLKPQVDFFPVLLGGLYADTKAPQGKDGSATDIMARAKVAITSRDLMREASRHGVPLNYNSKHPVRSVKAMRALANTRRADERARFAHALFRTYWVEDGDVSSDEVVAKCAREAGAEVAESGERDVLRENTSWASARGVFGVPTFFIMEGETPSPERFFHGQDRMFFLARALGAKDKWALPLRLETGPNLPSKHVLFFHDFASPWSYLGWTQLEKLAPARVTLRPILLGALFRAIGTPDVPMFAMSEAKRAYGGVDLDDFVKLHQVGFTFPKAFPLRTVLPLRVSLCEPRAVGPIYSAAWVEGLNVGDEQVLVEVLDRAGLEARALVGRAKGDEAVKKALVENTTEAQNRGVCGVPSYVVDEGEVVWGQDRLHVVLDELAAGHVSRI